MEVYNDLANIIGSYGNKITLHKLRSSEPHAIYYMYYNNYEFRYSFGSHGTYGISIKNFYKEEGTLFDGDCWHKDGDEEVSPKLPEEIVGLVAEMKHYFENKEE